MLTSRTWTRYRRRDSSPGATTDQHAYFTEDATSGDGVRQRRIEDGEYAKYCLTGNGARMMIAHGAAGAASISGTVAIRLM